MEKTRSERQSLKQRLRAGERLSGVFVKTAHHQIVEVLARTGLDFIVLDAEHAPFDRADLDRCLMASHLGGLPALVRIPSTHAEWILSVLDMGATGIMAPHISSAEAARNLVAAAKYEGARGFSTSHRAGGYGRADFAAYQEAADRETVVIAQIEDREAIDDIDSIMAVDGVDCAFIGRADLMTSYGVDSLDDRKVAEAVSLICQSANQHDRRIGLFLGSPEMVDTFSEAGANLFVVGSDQSLLKGAAKALTGKMKLDN